jgi:hypothetical protein
VTNERVALALRVLLAALGVAVLVALVVEAGPALVFETLAATGAWVFALALFELAAATTDLLAVRAIAGRAGRVVPTRVFIRSSLLAILSAQLLPGGRVLGEVARAASLAPHVGAARAAATAILTHGTYLLAISLTALTGYAAVSTLAVEVPVFEGLLLWTSGFTLSLGALFLAGPRFGRIGGFLGRRIGLLGTHGPRLDRALARAPVFAPLPFSLFVAGRALHVAQSGALLVAVGDAWDAKRALVSESIQLVAANVGDTVPGQTGVVEAAYRAFGPELGLIDAAALAVAMALLVRVARLIVASGAALAVALTRPAPVPSKARSRADVSLGAAPLALALLVAPVALDPGVAHGEVPLEEGEEPRARAVVRERLAFVVNPMGVEHMISLAARVRLGDARDPLMEDAHLEVGAVTYTSPIYSMTGAYAELSPIAFLVLRAEITGVALWPIGLQGAGFYALDGYEADVRGESLDGARGSVAAGVNVQLGATLRAAVALGPIRPILWSELVLEVERLGEQPFRYSPKYDLVLGREDLMLASSTMLLIELALSDTLRVRAGAYDDLRAVPSSGHLVHQIGPTLMVALDTPGETIREVLFVARAGVYTDPSRREGEWTGLAALLARYDL